MGTPTDNDKGSWAELILVASIEENYDTGRGLLENEPTDAFDEYRLGEFHHMLNFALRVRRL